VVFGRNQIVNLRLCRIPPLDVIADCCCHGLCGVILAIECNEVASRVCAFAADGAVSQSLPSGMATTKEAATVESAHCPALNGVPSKYVMML
jgi:hypothetical protein